MSRPYARQENGAEPDEPTAAPTDTVRPMSESSTEKSLHTRVAERLVDGRSSVGQPTVSPDGSRVAFVVATTSLENNNTTSLVWIDDAPVTGGDHDANPTWSPDGRHLAFTSRRSEKKGESTLHVMPVAAPGETRTLCSMPDGLGELAWSPDGRSIAFTSRTQDERYTKESDAWRSPRKVERLFARLNGEDWVFDRPQHVFMVNTDGTGTPRNLTPGDFEHKGPAWLPDSSAVVVSAQRHDTWDTDLASDIYLVPADADTNPDNIRSLTQHDGDVGFPSVSPDGTHVALLGHGEIETGSQNAHVGIIPIDSSTSIDDVTWISKDLDRTFVCMAGMRAPLWDGNDSLLATAEDRGDNHLYRLAADGSAAPEAVTAGRLTVHSFDQAGGTLVTTRSTIDHTPELFVGEDRRTTVGDALAAHLLPWEKFTVPTTDGSSDIDVWIMRPADFDESKTYPVLLNVHGGPFTQYGDYFSDEAQMQAAAGFVVVLGNPRGGSGREQSWGQAILGPKHPVPGSGWGALDVDDVLAILDGALERYTFCDPNRVGMLGGSYGGFMATWLAGHHGERFRAFCSERSVNNLLSEEWSSDISTAFRTEHGPSHIEDPTPYTDASPINAVRNIDKPMLLIHSEEDWRCPIVQAEELWIALKLLGKEVDFYRFPGENHELSRSGSPIHRVQRAEIILDWFADKLA
jgi:dipeptidyl aminopeptidase/acylaminoacyl peptidase